VEQRLSTLGVVADIFDGYVLAEAWDEMFAAPGEPRAAYDALVSVLQPMDPGELKVNSSQGGGSKDTWVLDQSYVLETVEEAKERLAMALPEMTRAEAASAPEMVAITRQIGPDQ